MNTHDVGASRASWMHACTYQGNVKGFNCLKTQWDPGADYLSGWDACGVLLLMWKVYMVCFHQFHFFN